MPKGKSFSDSLNNLKIPMLILDQKWHRLFALGGKPDEVQELESKEGELLKREAELKKELKDLKKVKESLMASVMNNMEGTADLVSKKLDDDKRLLEECKERIQTAEDELLELPAKIDDNNKELMLATMEFCYDKLRKNTSEAEEITNWIKDIRVQLKKNIIRKHNREINNKEIYSYMHDVFGMEILNLFDLQNSDFSIGIADDHPDSADNNDNSKSINSDEVDNSLSDIELEDIDLDSIEKEKNEDASSDDADSE